METETMPVVETPAMTAQPNITLTPLAVQKFQQLIAEKNLIGYGLRVFVAGSGGAGLQYGMAFENKTEEGDAVFDANGLHIYLDATSAMYLDGAIVDYVEGPGATGFSIENPNAEAMGGCSCGNEGGGCGCGNCG